MATRGGTGGWFNKPCANCGKHPIFGHTHEERRACRLAKPRDDMRRWRKAHTPRKDRLVMARTAEGRTELMSERQALKQMGASKRGLNRRPAFIGADPRAAQRLSEKRAAWSGRLVGRSSKRRPAVKRAPLRALHAGKRDDSTWYDPCLRWWWKRAPSGVCWVITERAALRRLGYLHKKPTKRAVPVSYEYVIKGRKR